MAHSLYIKSLPPDTTLEALVIYFQSSNSGGGDVNSEASRLEGHNAVVVFDEKEYLDNVLQRTHEIGGHQLEISDQPFKPVPKKRTRLSAPIEKETSNEKAYLGEVRTVIVSGFSPNTTNETLEMFFESNKRSGGGEVESFERNEPDVAHITFLSSEVASSVLQRKKLEIEGYIVQVKEKQVCLKMQTSNEKAYLGEVRTVIVSGISPNTTNETLEMFFESKKRSGGGEVESFERNEPDVAHITFLSSEVASNVLQQKKLEIEGYIVQLKERQPKLFLPLDMRKLYVENIDPKTTEDSLTYYMEARTKQDITNVQFGEHGNALVTLAEKPDMKKVMENNKPLEGAILHITNPPVCNSIIITGLSTNTTKQAIEMYFENDKNGGGKIYGDIIYQKDKGKAAVSFCDPDVVQTLCNKPHRLNGSTLSLHQYFAFMTAITETEKLVKVDAIVLDHVKKNCKDDFRSEFGIEMPETYDEQKEVLTLPNETKEDIVVKIQSYMDQFTVNDLPFNKKVLDKSREELKMMMTKVKKKNLTIALDEQLLRIRIIGTASDVNEVYEQFKNTIAEIEKGLNMSTKQIPMPVHKLELFLLHGVDEMLMENFHVDVNIEPKKKNITIKGEKNQVSLATKLVYEKCAEITEDNIDLNESQKHFLESGGLDMFNNDFKAKGLKGMVFLNRANKPKVVVFDSATVEDVYLQLSDNMFEKKLPLDEDSISLLKSNKWKEFNESVTTNTSVSIYIGSSSSPEISLIGHKSEVMETFDKLQEFMRRNTIVKESILLGEGNIGYMSKFCMKDLEEIENRLEEHLVRVQLQAQGIVDVYGTKDGVQKAKALLQDIAANIVKDEICFEKIRMQKYLESEEGKIFLTGIESERKCLIELIKDDGERSTTISSTQSALHPGEPTAKLLCSYSTPENISLKVYKDDITSHRCDVIVNAANGDLKHIGGVAKSIVSVGGKAIQEECDAYIETTGKLYEGEYFSGSPGMLPCKRLVHAVGPRWDDYSPEKARQLLGITCSKVLEESLNYQSIALPAIGSGVFRIPKQTCADVMIEVAEEFSKKHANCALKEIHFVNNDDATGQVFAKKFQEKFRGRSSFNDNQATTGRNRSQEFKSRPKPKNRKREKPNIVIQELPKPKAVNFVITKTNMKISVIVGDLSTHKADVLVNTTAENLKLDSNPCSKALSNEAGPVLEAECSKIGKLKVGEVAVTQGGNLLCDEVYHVVCVQWNGGEGEQVLRSIVKDCLTKCNSNGKKSIAFPAIGTGTLGFPHSVAAKIFFEETKEFVKKIPNSSIKEVSFVVYNQDSKSIHAFKNELKKQAEWGKTAADTTVPNVSQHSRRRNQGPNSESADTKASTHKGGDKENVMCIQVGDDKEIEIVKGDIAKETSDVIGHLTNPGLSLRSGVGMALARAGGEGIERELQGKASIPKIASTVLTAGGQLKVKYVAHMIASNDPNPGEIEKCVNNCLKMVAKEGCKSISFPAVGTGQLKHDPEKAATTILTSIIRFFQSSSDPLKTVRVVLNDDALVATFLASVEQLNQEEEPGMWKKLVNFFWKTESTAVNVKQKPPVNTTKLFLVIYANHIDAVNLARKNIQKIMDSHQQRKKVEDENIAKLSEQQIAEIEQLCEINEIKVTIEKQLNRIFLVGHSDDISKAVGEIFSILKTVAEAEKEKETADLHADMAEIVSQGVQWFWVDPNNGDNVEYDKRTNADIEKAYSKKEKSIIFPTIDDEQCEIVFNNMEETNLKTTEKIKVIRKDLKAIHVADVSVPQYWEAQPLDGYGKELSVHLVVLNPNNPAHKAEHKMVSDHFHRTAGNAIQQIQRIQNPSLYKLYAIKKGSLDKKQGSNEQFLFHGTNGSKLKEINEKGLNRSYAGNTNGVAFGRGVYFARDASMSVGYAHPDALKKRYMYYTRAAVGQYTVGNSSMVVPPPKGGNDSYDSTVNQIASPTIYVLFYDAQYYPEYLITFT